MYQHVMCYVVLNWIAGIWLHVKALRSSSARPKVGELVMYCAAITLIGSLVGLYVLCRFMVTFLFDWSDYKSS